MHFFKVKVFASSPNKADPEQEREECETQYDSITTASKLLSSRNFLEKKGKENFQKRNPIYLVYS